MKRNAFVMKLKPGFEAEYKKRHDVIWPELHKELKAAGISDYSIFLDEPHWISFRGAEVGGWAYGGRVAGDGDRQKVVGVYEGHHGQQSG